MYFSNTTGPTSRWKIISTNIFIICIALPFTLADNNASPPSVNCETSKDCFDYSEFIRPYPVCVMGLCVCNTTDYEDSQCIHYSQIKDKGNKIYYSCAPCGTIGSLCFLDDGCQEPGVCRSRLHHYGYCECKRGQPDHELCMYYHSVSTSKGTIWMVILLVIMLILNKCISSHVFIRERCLRPAIVRIPCCRICSNRLGFHNEVIQAENPQSGTKSASYTISARNFMSCFDDPDYQWALQLSIAPQPSTSQEPRDLNSERRRVRLAQFRHREINRKEDRMQQRISSFKSSSSGNDGLSLYSSACSTPNIMRRSQSLPLTYKKKHRESRENNYPEDSNTEEIIMNQVLKRSHYSSNQSGNSNFSTSTAFSTIYDENLTEGERGDSSASSGSFVSIEVNPQYPSTEQDEIIGSDDNDPELAVRDCEKQTDESVAKALFHKMTLPLSIILGDRTLLFLHKSQLVEDPTD